MCRRLRLLAALWIIVGSSIPVRAEQVGLMPIPVLQNVQVQAEVSFDSTLGHYTCRYVITNPPTNTGEIWSIDIDISQPFRERVFTSKGLTIPFGVSTLTFDEVLAMRRNPTPMVPVGMQVPPGWDGGLGSTGFAGFTSGDPLTKGSDKIIPGEKQGGFELISPGMPTIRQIKLIPDWVLLVPTEEEATPALKQRAREIKASLPFRTMTLGPSAMSPGSFGHWDQLRDDLNQAIQLSWVPDQPLATALVSQLASARQALDATDGTLAKTRLQTLIQTITTSAPAQRRREVFDLVLLNAQRLKEATPDTVFPIEPKLKLSPQSSTLPLGTLYTLTGTVVNLGNPANPPQARLYHGLDLQPGYLPG